MLSIVSFRVFLAQAQPAKDQSFFAPEVWSPDLVSTWTDKHPRMLADVNGDGRQDVVGFGRDGVWLLTSTGTNFNTAFVLEDFGENQGWNVSDHVRTVADINGDGKQDIIGFGDLGTWFSLSTGAGFAAPQFFPEFGHNTGWRVSEHVRTMADVNGDRKQDIVGFGIEGTWFSLSTGAGFAAPQFFPEFGHNTGWRVSEHVRTMADINGDGKQDIVGFGIHGVWFSLSIGAGFAPPQFVAEFGNDTGWKVSHHIRATADINNDGMQDLVGFGIHGVWFSLSTGVGFATSQFLFADFGYDQGWRVRLHPRLVADLNGDGYQDIVGFGQEAVFRALGGPGGIGGSQMALRALVVGSPFPNASTFNPEATPRLIGDVDGDGRPDLVAFLSGGIQVARSSDMPPPPPPKAPTNLRFTGVTGTSLTVAWDDQSNDERRFLIRLAGGGDEIGRTTNANETSTTFHDLKPDTRYCFTVQAESLWGLSGEGRGPCRNTLPKIEEPPPPPQNPAIFVGLSAPDANGNSFLFISGQGFNPFETVRLTILVTSPGGNPVTFVHFTTANSFGHINHGAGLACGPLDTREFETQGTGLTSMKKSNIAKTGC
jgi:hypothetical protein